MTPEKARIAKTHLCCLAAYLFLTLLLTYPLVLQFTKAIPGDGFDGWQNYWNLWWMKVALLEEHRSPFTTDLLYHPTGVNLYFHTLNPFNGLLTLPVQLAWGLLPAYNLVVLFSFAIGGYGAYLLARYTLAQREQGSKTEARSPKASEQQTSKSLRLASCILHPAFVAGLIYTFAPFHFAHLLGHMQVISLQWIPFYIIYLLKALAPSPRPPLPRPSPLVTHARDALLAAFFLVLVALCDWYYVFYCLLFTVLLLAYLACRRRLTVRAVLVVVAIGLLFGLALSPLLWPMVQEARHFRFMVPDPAQTRALSADLLAFITPQEFHPLWGQQARAWASAFSSTTSERTVFAGFVPLLLALTAILPTRNTQYATRTTTHPSLWVLTLLTFLILSLGPVLHIGGRTALLPGGGEIPLPYALLHRFVPFLNITRSVSRFDVMVMLSLALLAGFGLARLTDRWKRGLGRKVALLSAALIVFEFLPAPYPMSPPDTPDWYHTLAAEPGDFAVLNLPMNWDRTCFTRRCIASD